MNGDLVTIKKSEDIQLKDIYANIEKIDGVLKSVTLSDHDGNCIKIAIHNYNELKVLVDKSVLPRDGWRLTGKFGNVKIDQKFDTEKAAKDTKKELEENLKETNFIAELSIHKISINRFGEIINAQFDEHDEIPF